MHSGGVPVSASSLLLVLPTDHQMNIWLLRIGKEPYMASEWHDYKELKYYLYELWEKEIWDTLSQDIKRLYWNNLKELLGEANADMEFGGNDETDLYVLQPDDSDNNKKRRKKRKKRGYLRTYSIGRAMEDGIDYPYSSTPEVIIIQQETSLELHAAIDTLDTIDQDIINLYYFEDLTERQIGEVLDMKQKTVNNHKNSSLEKMRTFLGENP